MNQDKTTPKKKKKAAKTQVSYKEVKKCRDLNSYCQ